MKKTNRILILQIFVLLILVMWKMINVDKKYQRYYIKFKTHCNLKLNTIKNIELTW
jgi:hypothetical protein